MADLQEQVTRQGILIEILYQTLMPHGTDKVFTSPPSKKPSYRSKRSRSRSPPPAPRKEEYRPRQYSDYNIHVISVERNSLVPEEVINYIDDNYGITVTSCTIDPSGYTACIKCLTREDQQILLEEKHSELVGRFNLKALQRRLK